MVLAGLCWAVGTQALAAAPVDFHGMPFLKRFSASDYRGSPGSDDLMVGDDGYLYLANRRGLLRFDGSRWGKLELDGWPGAYALAQGRDGVVYLGGDDEFGRLQLDASGDMEFVDISAEFSNAADEGAAAPEVGAIWTAHANSQGVYFRTESNLFFSGYAGERKVWPIAEGVRRIFVANDQLYARVEGVGLARWVDGEFVLLRGGEQFAALGIASIVEAREGALVVSDGGFFRLQDDRVRALPTADNAALQTYVPNTSVRLDDGGVLVGSETGELVQFSRDLQLIAAYPLARQAIGDMMRDREGGVWIVTEAGLTRVEFPSRWAAYGEAHGLYGEARDSAYHRDSLWAATSQGLFRGHRDQRRVQFDQVLKGSMWGLLADPSGLFVIDDLGVLLLADNGEPQRLLEERSAFELVPSSFHDGRIFALTDDDIVLLQRNDGRWSEHARWPLQGASVDTLLETSASEFWINDYNAGPQLWNWDAATATVLSRRPFAAEHGLVIDDAYGTSLSRLGSTIYAVSGSAVFKWRDDQFVVSDDAPFSLVDDPNLLSVTHTTQGDFAFTDRQLFRRAPGAGEWQRLHLGDPLAQGFSNLQVDADGKLRVSSWNGVLQFDPVIPENVPPVLSVQLQRAVRQNSEGVQENLLGAASSRLLLPPDDLLRLSFAMGSLESPSEIRYRVKGLINSWSPWTPGEAQLTLRYPGPGHFTLEVEGRTQTGRSGVPLQVPIVASPRWWQTPLALVAGALLASLITLLLSQRFRRYRQERDDALEVANSDALTGVLNRRAAEARLRNLAHKSRGRAVTFSVLFVDIDHFKAINDRYGHAIGDICLKAVADRVRGELRGGDALARWGGEEFLCLLDGAAAADAHRIAERIRTRVAGHPIDADGQPVSITVSMGVGVFAAVNDSTDKLVARADEALYQAKAAGRNRVMPVQQALEIGEPANRAIPAAAS